MSKNQSLFEKYFLKALKESMTTDSAGVGGTAGTTSSSDFYAPGDARLPHSIFGKVIKRTATKKKRKGKRKKSKSKKKSD